MTTEPSPAFLFETVDDLYKQTELIVTNLYGYIDTRTLKTLIPPTFIQDKTYLSRKR